MKIILGDGPRSEGNELVVRIRELEAERTRLLEVLRAARVHWTKADTCPYADDNLSNALGLCSDIEPEEKG